MYGNSWTVEKVVPFKSRSSATSIYNKRVWRPVNHFCLWLLSWSRNSHGKAFQQFLFITREFTVHGSLWVSIIVDANLLIRKPMTLISTTSVWFIFNINSYGNAGPRPPPFGGGMHSTRNRSNANNYLNQQNNGMLPEPLIWTYVVQLTSALRTIHQVNILM